MYDLRFVMLSEGETYDVADARFYAMPVVVSCDRPYSETCRRGRMLF